MDYQSFSSTSTDHLFSQEQDDSGNMGSITIPLNSSDHLFSQEQDDSESCTCHKEILLENSSGLKEGDHITRDLNKGSSPCCRKSILSHHTIILKVKPQESSVQDGKVTLKLAHMAKKEDKTFEAQKSVEVFDFNKQDVYKVEYFHPLYKDDDVVRNAKTVIANKPEYKYLEYNCEHFCVFCVTGQKSSFQVENLSEFIQVCCSNFHRLPIGIFTIVSAVLAASDDVVASADNYKGQIPGGLLIFQCILLLCYLCIIFAPCISTLLKFNFGKRCKTCLCISFLKLLGRLVYVFLTILGIIVSFFHNNKIKEGQTISDKVARDFKAKSISITVCSLLYVASIEIFFKCSLKCRRKWFKYKYLLPLCARNCYNGCGRQCIEKCCCCADKCIKKIIRCRVNCCDWIPSPILIIFALAASVPDFVCVMIHTSESSIGDVFDWIVIIKCVLLSLYLQAIFCPLIYAFTAYTEDKRCEAFRKRSICKFLFRLIAVVINVGGMCVLIVHSNALKENKSILNDEYKTLQNKMKIFFSVFISYMSVLEVFLKIWECSSNCCIRCKDGCKCK